MGVKPWIRERVTPRSKRPSDTATGYFIGAFLAAMTVIFCLIVRTKKY